MNDHQLAPRRPEPPLSLDAKRTQKDVEALPDATVLASNQMLAAYERIDEDTTGYPRYPWSSLAELAGPMCPEDLILVAARTGGGKSLFLQNLFDALIVAGRFGLYIGLEQSPDILRTKWACLRSDVPPKLVLAPRPIEQGSSSHSAAVAAVKAELKWQLSADIRARAHFASARKINAAGLRAWTTWAVDHGCEFVIVDHVDRVHHGDGSNSFHEVSETVRLAKELAAEHRIVMLMASQVGRPADALEVFMPPALHNMRGAGTKEEEADVVLGIYRPLKAGVSDKAMTEVRRGLKPREELVEPGVMGVMLLKHRLDGPVAGRMVRLNVRHQRVTEPSAVDLWRSQEGIG